MSISNALSGSMVKKAYRVRNWREYEAGLRNRGSLTVWISLTAGGSGSRPLGYSSKLALAYLHAPRSLARTPVPGLWRAFGYNPARSGRHGERDTKFRHSRRVRFCQHT